MAGLSTYGALGQFYGTLGDTYGASGLVIPIIYSPTSATFEDEREGVTGATGDSGITGATGVSGVTSTTVP